MNIIIYISSLILFIRYFIAIGARYIAILPFLIIFFLFFYSGNHIRFHNIKEQEFKSYTIFIAWISILIGIIGILQFISPDNIYTGITILCINIIFWISSYYTNYTDGKYMAQTGYYASSLYILRQSSYILDTNQLLLILSGIWILTMAIVGFIIGVMKIFSDIESYMYYKLMILLGGAIVIIINNYIQNINYILLIDASLLLVFSIFMYLILQYKAPSIQKTKEISLRRILAGERIIKNTHIPHQNMMLIKIHNFIYNMPYFTQKIIEISNSMIVIITIILYLQNISQAPTLSSQITYRGIIIIFISTSLVLKNIGFVGIFQKITLFGVINYAIYLTLYSLFSGTIGRISIRAIMRNIFSSLLIFYGPQSPISHILKRQDYRYWIVMTIIAFMVNIYILGLTNIPGQLMFSIIFIYLGIQGLLLYYAIKHINESIIESDYFENSSV